MWNHGARRERSRGTGPGRRPARWITDRSTHTKFLVAVCLLAIVAIAGTVVAIWRMAEVDRSAQQLYSASLVPVERINQVESIMYRNRLNVMQHTVSSTD